MSFLFFLCGFFIGVFLGVFGFIVYASYQYDKRRATCGMGHPGCNGHHPRED